MDVRQTCLTYDSDEDQKCQYDGPQDDPWIGKIEIYRRRIRCDTDVFLHYGTTMDPVF